MAVCVFPGSFDPVTKGHLDLIERASRLFDEVIVAVLYNPAKTGLFPAEERIRLLRKACAHLSNVCFDSFDGLLVDFMRNCGARVVIRGLRSTADFESEFQMAQLNHQMKPEVETLFMTTAPEYAHVSSSAVREIGSFDGDISPFVPACIVPDVVSILCQH
ncbi:MAG: pantetheine-phosphate adenylyltransferase [Clostridia bacterium]|nr:pantetheine-phosphate adenylyltransferase [Clostridia bacterium]